MLCPWALLPVDFHECEREKVMWVWMRATSQEGPGGYRADGHEDERWVGKKSRVVKDNSPKTQINQDSAIWHTADGVAPRFS